MNLAFDISRDKPLTWEDFRPGKVASLLDMLEFYAVVFMNVCTQLAIWEEMIQNKIETDSRDARDRLVVNPPDDMRESFSGVRDELRRLHLNISMRSSEDIISFVKSEKLLDAQELRHLFRCFRAALLYELEDRRILMVSPSRSDYYNCQGTFLTADVIQKLSKLNLAEDATEAGNCFALGRYTACVFHLMRIMEKIVQNFGKKVGITLDVRRASWDNILKQVKKLTKIEDTDSPDEKTKKLRYQSFYDRLDAVRVAWRNPVMHPKVTYTHEEAREVLDAVRLFVKDFSTLRRFRRK